MKKLIILTSLLLVTALLYGCIATGTGGSNPTGNSEPIPTQSTAPTATEPKPTQPQGPTELSYTSYVAAWADTKAFPNDRLYVIRSAQQLQETFGGALTVEQLEKYTEAYFVNNTLLCFTLRELGEGHWYYVSDLSEAENDGYSMTLEHYYTDDPKNENRRISFVLVTEVNRVIEWDAELSICFDQYKFSGSSWEEYFGGTFFEDNFIKGSVPIEYTVSEIHWETKDLKYKGNFSLVDSVEKLSECWYGAIPKEFQKYDEAFFQTSVLFFSGQYDHSGVRLGPRRVFITADGMTVIAFYSGYNWVLELPKEAKGDKNLRMGSAKRLYLVMEPNYKKEYYVLSAS